VFSSVNQILFDQEKISNFILNPESIAHKSKTKAARQNPIENNERN